MITGKLIRKENFATFFLSSPQRSPAQIVEPEREIPGRTAIPWATPITIEVKLFLRNPLSTV